MKFVLNHLQLVLKCPFIPFLMTSELTNLHAKQTQHCGFRSVPKLKSPPSTMIMAVTARHIGARALRLISKRAFHLPAPVACISSQSILDEELCPGYNPENYYPAKPGQMLGEQFQLLAKVGWGANSTVWLARDING